jgi:hypothetical protein
MGAHKTQGMPSALTKLYHNDGNKFLNHFIQVTGDETLVSFVNVETKEQSKQWTHTFTKQAKQVQTLSARKLMASVFWDRDEVLMVEFMQQGTTIMSEVY